MKIKWIFVIMLLFVLIGCNNNDSSENTEQPPIINEEPIIHRFDEYNRINSVNNGFLAEDEDYYYFNNAYNRGGLYRRDKVTGEMLQLVDPTGDLPLAINVYDDKVYFLLFPNDGRPEASLYSINKDGSDLTEVHYSVELDYVILDDTVYFTGSWHEGLYEYNMTTKEEKNYHLDETFDLNLVDRTLYYYRGGSFVEFNLDTKEERVIAIAKNFNYGGRTIYSDGYLYYIGYEIEDKENINQETTVWQIYQVDIATGENKTIFTRRMLEVMDDRQWWGAPGMFVVRNDVLYFICTFIVGENKYEHSIFKYENEELSIIATESRTNVGLYIYLTEDYLVHYIGRSQVEGYRGMRLFDYEGNEIDYNLYE